MGSKITKSIFFIIFIAKFSNFISNLNDYCSQLSFEVYNVFVAKKLRISEFFIEFFSSGPWPHPRPLEAAISTSATSIGYQILAEYLSFHMRYCLLLWNEIGRSYTTFFPKWIESAPPMYLGDQKAHVF